MGHKAFFKLYKSRKADEQKKKNTRHINREGSTKKYF